MAWWRRNGSRKRATNGSNGANGTGMAARIEAEQLAVATVFGPDDAPTDPAPSASSTLPDPPAPAAPTVPALAPFEAAPAPPAPEPVVATAPAPAPAPAPVAPAPAAPDDLVPTGTARRRIGELLARSRATAVHAVSLVDVDLDRVERVRLAAGLDVDAFVARAVTDALARHPHLNASVEDDGLRIHRDVHLGIAVDVDPEGMVAPVVRAADGKRLRALAGEIAELHGRARTATLGPGDLAGATFTIGEPESQPGLVSIPIIHQPQVAILGVGGIQRRPVAVPLPDGGEAISIHPVAPLALVWDHRAVDRAYASAFLASVRDSLETRDWQAEL